MRMCGLTTYIWYMITAQCIIGFMALTVNRDNADLISVPQDIDVTVTSLSLTHNKFIIIDNGSFPLYRKLNELIMDNNPLEEIKSGAFDNNPELVSFLCSSCKLSLFPVDFSPASASLETLWFMHGIKNITAFSQMKLYRFTSLADLSLFGVPATEITSIKFPTSLWKLGIGGMKLAVFPNLSYALFPNLMTVGLGRNKFQTESNFLGVTETIEKIFMQSSNLHCADGLDLLPKLAVLEIHNNKLETIPDLLALSNLRRLYIKGNSRMNCDQRMCWRRLWDRVREPFRQSDDVICVEPPLLAGHAMSTVNPKFMHCSNGKSIRKKGIISPEVMSSISCQGLVFAY